MACDINIGFGKVRPGIHREGSVWANKEECTAFGRAREQQRGGEETEQKTERKKNRGPLAMSDSVLHSHGVHFFLQRASVVTFLCRKRTVWVHCTVQTCKFLSRTSLAQTDNDFLTSAPNLNVLCNNESKYRQVAEYFYSILKYLLCMETLYFDSFLFTAFQREYMFYSPPPDSCRLCV